MSSSSSVFLDIARWVFSLRHKLPAWQGKRSVQDRLYSKQMHPLMHTDFLNIWITAQVAKPPMKSAVLFGCEDRNGLVPIYFKGQIFSDFLQDLICT
jgi:hypothetical protein